jgi:hypothetical protein
MQVAPRVVAAILATTQGRMQSMRHRAAAILAATQERMQTAPRTAPAQRAAMLG